MAQNKLMATEELENHTATGLLDLPVELLLKIIALVPDTSALTLTCKKLYNFVFLCDASKKYKINIRHEDLLLDFATFCHILSSQRILDTIEISIPATTSQLYWVRVGKILASRSFSSLIVNNTRSKGNNNDVELSKVLIKNVKDESLKELKLIEVDLETLGDFFEKQKAIKVLSITGHINATTAGYINQLDLRSLTLSLTRGFEAMLVINSQPKLTKLVLECSGNTPNTAEIISQSSLILEELKLPKACSDFTTISKLKKLKKWTIYFNSSIPSIPSLEELNLTVDEYTTKEDIIQLSAKLPNLKILSVKGVLAINCLELTSNFKKLESLSIENRQAVYCKMVDFPTIGPQCSLKHVKIVNQDPKVVIYSASLFRYLKSFEKLQTLSLEIMSEVSFDMLRLLLTVLPVRELVIDLYQRYSIIDAFQQIVALLESGKVKFIKFLNFNCDENDIRAVFGHIFPIIAKEDQHLIMRKHGRFRLLKPPME